MDYLPTTTPAGDISLKSIGGIVWRRKWVILVILSCYLALTYVLTARTERLYQATAHIMLIQRNPSAPQPAETALTAPLLETPETQLAMLKTDGMGLRTQTWLRNQALSAGTTKDKHGLIDNKSIWRSFPEIVKATNPENTNVISVTVTYPDPEIAAALANVVCQTFVDWKKEIAQESVQKIVQSLETRTQRARSQMIDVESVESAFKQHQRLVDVPAQQKALLDAYLARDTEVDNLRNDISFKKAHVAALEQRLRVAGSAVKGSNDVKDADSVGSLRTELNRLKTEYARLSLRFQPAHPDVRALDAQIASLQQRLDLAVRMSFDNTKPGVSSYGTLYEDYKQAEADLRSSEARLADVSKLRDNLKSQTAGLSDTSLRYARLARNSELARGQYVQLQAQLNAAKLNTDMATGNVQLTAWAVPPSSPFQPNVVRNMSLGVVIGLALALLGALAVETADRRLRSVDDIRRVVHGPVIGSLPLLPRHQMEGLVRGDLTPAALEGYSMARANLAMVVRGAGVADPFNRQVILVTSAVPGEGKSVTAAHMARSLARSGKTVILVDADMRRPTQNSLFKTAEPLGLADVLSGDLPLDDALVSSDTENLYVLHSGTPKRNPTDLISSSAAARTLEALRNEADVVIVDSPACAVVADALLLAPHVDSVLHVVGAGKADENTLSRTTAALRAASKNMVFFVNRAPKDRSTNVKGYYGYQYMTYMGGQDSQTAAWQAHVPQGEGPGGSEIGEGGGVG